MEFNKILPRLSKLMTLAVGCIITGQIAIILFQGEGICLNEGCKIVERLTRVSPLVFNLAGLIYFICLFWSLHLAGKGSSGWLWFSRLLLLAGIGAEGVLVGFQHIIANAFCSYCLIILGFILLLNCLAGWRQILRGLFVFAAVLVAMFSLEFGHPPGMNQSLKEGTFAVRTVEAPSEDLTLFFSSTCKHCENVIEALRDNSTFSLAFNPVDEVTSLNFPGAVINPGYAQAINRRFLASLEIEEIPVMVARKKGTVQVLQGEQAILDYLYPPEPTPAMQTQVDYSGSSNIQDPLLPGLQTDKDGCKVTVDCDDADSLNTPAGQAR